MATFFWMHLDKVFAGFTATSIRLLFAYDGEMGIGSSGHRDETAWPKLGPSLLIASCLILAVRTAKWSQRSRGTTADMDLEAEIEHAVTLARRTLSVLLKLAPSIFPQRKIPLYEAMDDEDVPR
jgi:hypothetical protein